MRSLPELKYAIKRQFLDCQEIWCDWPTVEQMLNENRHELLAAGATRREARERAWLLTVRDLIDAYLVCDLAEPPWSWEDVYAELEEALGDAAATIGRVVQSGEEWTVELIAGGLAAPDELRLIATNGTESTYRRAQEAS